MPKTLSVNEKVINFYLGNTISLFILTTYTGIKLYQNADWDKYLTYDMLALNIVFGINMLYCFQICIRCAEHKGINGCVENVRVSDELWGSNKIYNWLVLYREIWVVGDLYVYSKIMYEFFSHNTGEYYYIMLLVSMFCICLISFALIFILCCGSMAICVNRFSSINRIADRQTAIENQITDILNTLQITPRIIIKEKSVSIEEDIVCSICTEQITNFGFHGPCDDRHLFHKDCIEELKKNIDSEGSLKCPLCREDWLKR